MSMSGHCGSEVAEAQYASKGKPVNQSEEIEKSDLECGSDTKAEVSFVYKMPEKVRVVRLHY